MDTDRISHDVSVNLNWNEIQLLEDRILDTISKLDAQNVGAVDVFLSRTAEQLNLRLRIEPLIPVDPLNTLTCKAVQCDLDKLEKNVGAKCAGIYFRQEKPSSKRIKMTSVGVQTVPKVSNVP